MKKLMLGAAAAVAIATPSAAFADTSGYIDAGYEATEYDGGGEFDALHLGGAIAHDLSSGWGVQADARAVNQEWDGSSSDDTHGYAAVHAYTNTGSWDFAGYVGLINYYDDGGKMIGVETRTAFGNVSVNGSLGYADFENGANDYNALDLRVNGAYFFNPNFALTGGVGVTEWDAFFDSDALDLSLGAAYQLTNGIALTGEYVNTDGDGAFGDWEVDSFRLGVRFNINGGDLQNVTNNGASWSGASDLSESMMRW
ncbi:MAG TPA: hypothetical protein VEA80_14950 [Vitreimonas sp.]|uniref:hypothetical protein n=1 Tax=Vitreimonas sp. TaxID=3069702 RepID=UPI002D4FC084|nr:hypothetical protein [Vitreimonas sp.]HYD88771.1 hypothetical protein [Vitreimonas sp.]